MTATSTIRTVPGMNIPRLWASHPVTVTVCFDGEPDLTLDSWELVAGVGATQIGIPADTGLPSPTPTDVPVGTVTVDTDPETVFYMAVTEEDVVVLTDKAVAHLISAGIRYSVTEALRTATQSA